MKPHGFVLMTLGFASIVTAAFVIRSGRPDPAYSGRTAASRTSPRQDPAASAEITYTPRYDPLPLPAPAAEASRAIHEASLKSTLQKYRNAVAAGSRLAQVSLLASLKRNEDRALQLAHEDLRRATADAERKSILGAIEAIRR